MHSYDESAIEEAKKTKPWRIIYSLLLKIFNSEHDHADLVIPLDANGMATNNVKHDKPRAIGLRVGDSIKFQKKGGKPEFFTIRSISAFRDAYCDEEPVDPDGFIIAVNR